MVAEMALALADTGVPRADRRAPRRIHANPAFDDRTTALGNASRRIF